MSDIGEWAERARKAQEAINEMGAGPPGRLSGQDRDVVAKARELGPVLRASSGDRDRLAGWLLADLAAIVERLAGPPATSAAALCKGCNLGAASVPCGRCGGRACASCGWCLSCGEPVTEADHG